MMHKNYKCIKMHKNYSILVKKCVKIKKNILNVYKLSINVYKGSKLMIFLHLNIDKWNVYIRMLISMNGFIMLEYTFNSFKFRYMYIQDLCPRNHFKFWH